MGDSEVWYVVEKRRHGEWCDTTFIHNTPEHAEQERRVYLRSYAPEDLRIRQIMICLPETTKEESHGGK